jgi:hypothetical protein
MDDGGVDDPARLHPLIAEAVGQVASLEAQLDYWHGLVLPDENHMDGPLYLGEEMTQRLDELTSSLAHRRGMRDRLMAKLITG